MLSFIPQVSFILERRVGRQDIPVMKSVKRFSMCNASHVPSHTDPKSIEIDWLNGHVLHCDRWKMFSPQVSRCVVEHLSTVGAVALKTPPDNWVVTFFVSNTGRAQSGGMLRLSQETRNRTKLLAHDFFFFVFLSIVQWHVSIIQRSIWYVVSGSWTRKLWSGAFALGHFSNRIRMAN